MKPILRGVVRFPEDGRTIWEGRWAMSEGAFDDSDPDKLHSFRYTCPSRVEFNVGDTIAFKGYFEVSSVNKGSKSQFTDKQLDMEVRPSISEGDNSDPSLRTVIGRGSNRFGPFEISGTFNALTHVLEVTRMYGPKAASSSSSSSSSAIPARLVKQPQPATEAPLSRPPDASKSSTALQPQSPSSPVDMTSSPVSKSREETPLAVVDTHFYADAKSVLKELKARDMNKWFSAPVDAAALGLHDYHGVVKHPMDLGTIQSRIDTKQYASWESCLADMRLVFFNALMYNPRSSLVYKAASDINAFLDERVKRLAGKSGKTLDATLVSTGIGKRMHKKKKIFEPGEGGALQTNPLAQQASQLGSTVKKTPKHSAFRVAQPTASAPSQHTKKAKVPTRTLPSQPVAPMAKRIKIVSSSFDIPSLADFSAFVEAPPPRLHHDDDDKESVVSFAGLDTQEDVGFMTPPQSDGEEEDDDMIIKQTPLSAIPLGEDYNAFSAVSPTNLGDADDF